MRPSFIATLACVTLATPSLAADRSFDVAVFDSVALSGAADVVVERGATASVSASGDAQALDRLDIRTEAGRLVIGQKPGSWNGRQGRVTVKVVSPDLRAATISGVGNLTVARPATGDFAARISGSGDLSLPQVAAGELSLAISGSGTLRAAGTCQSASIRVSGSGNVEAANLRCAAASAVVTGSGNVVTAASDTADVRITGSGNVTVAGTAKCTSRTSGSGTVRCG